MRWLLASVESHLSFSQTLFTPVSFSQECFPCFQLDFKQGKSSLTFAHNRHPWLVSWIQSSPRTANEWEEKESHFNIITADLQPSINSWLFPVACIAPSTIPFPARVPNSISFTHKHLRKGWRCDHLITIFRWLDFRLKRMRFIDFDDGNQNVDYLAENLMQTVSAWLSSMRVRWVKFIESRIIQSQIPHLLEDGRLQWCKYGW